VQGYNLTLLGVGSPTGLVAGDTITIAGVTYTAASSENTSTGQFQVYAAFTSSGVTATTNSTTSLTSVSPTTGIAVGQLISDGGHNIPAGTYVTAIVGSTVTMSQAATASGSGVAV